MEIDEVAASAVISGIVEFHEAAVDREITSSPLSLSTSGDRFRYGMAASLLMG